MHMSGQIKLPITRLEPSQKSAKGIHLTDLAAYLARSIAPGSSNSDSRLRVHAWAACFRAKVWLSW